MNEDDESEDEVSDDEEITYRVHVSKDQTNWKLEVESKEKLSLDDFMACVESYVVDYNERIARVQAKATGNSGGAVH